MFTAPQKLCLLRDGGSKVTLLIAAVGSRLLAVDLSSKKVLWVLDFVSSEQSEGRTKEVNDINPPTSNPFIRKVVQIPGTDAVLALCNDKTLRKVDCATGNCIAQIRLKKRAECFTLSRDNQHVLVADKFGDVWRHSLDMSSTTNELMLGHLSPISDIIQSIDGRYLITCDKDEHIRVSNYPNAYEIETFCLAHQDFISSLEIPTSRPDVLISGSCDGIIHVWSWKTASLLQSLNLRALLPGVSLLSVFKIVASPTSRQILITFVRSHIILAFDFDGENLASPSTHTAKGAVLDAVYDDQDILWITEVIDADLPSQQGMLTCYQCNGGKFSQVDLMPEMMSAMIPELLTQGWYPFKIYSPLTSGNSYSLKDVFWVEALRKQSSNGN